MESGYQFKKYLSTRTSFVKDASSSSSSRSMLLADLFLTRQQNNSAEDTTLKFFLKLLPSKQTSLDERLRCQECWQP